MAEITADRMALFALATWPRARETTSLPSRSPSFWTYVSTLLNLMMLVASAAVRKISTGQPGHNIDALEGRLDV